MQAGRTLHLEQAKLRWSVVVKTIHRSLPRTAPYRTREQASIESFSQCTKQAIEMLLASRAENAKLQKYLNFAKQDLDRQVHCDGLVPANCLTF
jgi:Zn-dependent oligopeptidase